MPQIIFSEPSYDGDALPDAAKVQLAGAARE